MRGAGKQGVLSFVKKILVIFFVLFFSTLANADDTALTNGLNWLKNNQKADGSWGTVNNLRDTFAVIDLYKSLGQSDSSYQNALNWINAFNAESDDYATRRLLSLNGSGGDLSADIQRIISYQNSDGGWGYTQDFRSNVYDTALVIANLKILSYDNVALRNGVSYLITKQNADGSWSYSENDGGDIITTCLSLIALSYYSGDNNVAVVLNRAISWLKTKQNADGGFGNSPSTNIKTAFAVEALLPLWGNAQIQSESILNAINYLKANQQSDGSWNQNVYETALALNDVGKKTNLTVLATDITLSNTAPGTGEILTVKATIKNIGVKSANNITVKAYADSLNQPRIELGEKVIAQLAGVSSASVEFTFDTKGLSGDYSITVVVDPLNAIDESKKDDNTSKADVAIRTVPDLFISNADITVSKDTAKIGEDVVITAILRNQGNGSVENVDLNFYLDVISEDTVIEKTYFASLGIGESASRQATLKANSVGDHNILVVADPYKKLDEVDKSNNQASKAIKVEALTKANLTVYSKDISFTPNPANQNESVQISAIVKNEGFSPADNIKVNFYKEITGTNSVLIGTVTIPSLNSGESRIASVAWNNIPYAGENIIHVKVDSDNTIEEYNETDNDAVTKLKVLSLPDLAISSNSIVFNPAAPKDGDSVAINVTVKNLGELSAANVVVKASEGGTVIGTQNISSMAGNSQAAVAFTYNTAGKQGAHEIAVSVDPDNLIVEGSKVNNTASRLFGVQNANLWVTEPYISPNGDGIKDSTQFFFRLDVPQTVKVAVVNKNGETVREFSGSELENTTSGNITWDGRNSAGVIVEDGQYRLKIVNMSGSTIDSIMVTVDNNRSPLSEAIGTNYLINNRLTHDMIPYSWKWFPDESGLLVYIGNNSYSTSEYPSGFYTVSSDGQDIVQIVSLQEFIDDPDYYYSISSGIGAGGYAISPDGNNIAFTMTKQRKDNLDDAVNEIWIVDRDGKNIKLFDSNSYVASELNFEAGFLEWSPNGNYILYTVRKSNGGMDAWFIKNDGTGKMKIDDFSSYEISITGWSPFSHWSPDSTKIIYSFIDSVNKTISVRLINLNGDKQDIFISQPVNLADIFMPVYFEWMNDQIIASGMGYSIGANGSGVIFPMWLLDSTGTGNNIKLADNSREYAISPDKSKIAFVDVTNDSQYIKIADRSGNVSIIYDSKNPQGSASIDDLFSDLTNINAINWSPDSSKIAFYDNAYEKIANDYEQKLIIIDIVKDTKKIFDTSGKLICFNNNGNCSYINTGRSGLKWLNDNELLSSYNIITYLTYLVPKLTGGSDIPKIDDYKSSVYNLFDDSETFLPMEQQYQAYVMDLPKGIISMLYPLSIDWSLSPFGKYILNYKANAYLDFYNLDGDIWAISSALNLTVDLLVKKEKSAVTLRGTAADLNFDSYKIEYADAQNPNVWNLVKPPSDMPVINDVFTTWVPPNEGVFYVKLTVWDKAGNIKWDRKKIIWGQSASITNLYKTADIISPNGDSAKDYTELHYTVLEPVNLEFNIYDGSNNIVRTFVKTNLSVGNDYISWDGRDNDGKIVPDGKYKIQVFDYDFFVQVDNTPPNADIYLFPIFQTCNIKSKNIGMVDDCSILISLSGLAYDVNLKNWNIEYGIGDNPAEWNEYQGGDDNFAETDENGAIIFPLQDKSAKIFDVSDVQWLIGKKFKISTEDYAANKSIDATGYLEERVVLYKWDGHDVLVKQNFDNAQTKEDMAIAWQPYDKIVPLLPADLIREGSHALILLVSVRERLTTIYLQYWNGQQWINGPAVNNPSSGKVELDWDNTGIDPNNIVVIRVKAIDETGKEYYSNMIFTKSLLSMLPTCFDGAYAYNDVFEKLSLLKIQIKSDDDINYSQWTDWVVYDAAKGDEIPEGKFQFYNPLTDNRIIQGKNYKFKMIAVGSAPGLYQYDPLEISLPPENCIDLKLSIDYPEAAQCNSLSGKAQLRIALPLNAFKSMDQLTSVDYYMMMSATDSSLLSHVDLSDGKYKPIYFDDTIIVDTTIIDTTQIIEGQYPVRAVLKYIDKANKTQSIKNNNVLIVDRVLPSAEITYPVNSSILCPTKNTDTQGDWFGIPIEGAATDNIVVKRYELYYGAGDNEPSILAATRVNGKTKPFIVEETAQGNIGTWNINDLTWSDYNLKLKVVDEAGNASCHTIRLSINNRVDINLFSDKKIFSPNKEDLNINYEFGESATVDVKVFNLIQNDGSSTLDQTPIRNIEAGVVVPEGTSYATWNGNNDAGVIVPDGSYGIAVFAYDSCGNVNTKWISVEVDNTPPETVITYPRPPDALGNIVEVRGTANDSHFANYVLEAGQGDNPTTWIAVSSGSSPIQEDILGKWNTFGLEGTWTLRLTANDSVGNQNTTNVTVNLGQRGNIIKNLSALPALFSPNNDGKLDTTSIQYELTDACQVKVEILDSTAVVQKTFTSTQSLGTYTYTWDGKNDTDVVVPDGVYTVKLTAVRSSSTSETQIEAVTVVVDVTIPTIDVKQPLIDAYLKENTLLVSGTVTDKNIKEYSLTYSGDSGSSSVDSGNQNRTNYNFGQLKDLPDGKYTLGTTAKDNAENTTGRNITFTIDTMPPKVTLDTPKGGEYYGADKSTVNISGSIVEKNLDNFKLRYGLGDNPAQWTEILTGNTVPTVSQLYTWKVGKNDGVVDGTYTLSLYAQDKAGWTDDAKVKIIVDNTLPDASITSPKNGDYVKVATDIQGTAFDANLDNYTMDLSEGECSSAYKWVTFKKSSTSVSNGLLGVWQTIPADGNCCIRLTAKDKTGLKAEAKVQVRVDTTPPAAPVLSGKIENKANASLNWTKNAEPDLAGYNLYKNGQKANAELLTDITYNDTNLKEGTCKYMIKAVDLAGNESDPSNEVSLKVDLTPPVVRIGSPSDGAKVSGMVDIKGSANGTDDFKQYRVYIGEGAAPATWSLIRTSPVPVTYGSLTQWDTSTDGVYSIKLEGEDINGNVGTSQISVTVDNTPPTKTVLLTVAPNGSDVTLTWQKSTDTDLAGYLLYRNDQLANAAGLVVTNPKSYLINGTTYVDKAIPDGKFKYYVVVMDQAGNTSDPSNELNVDIDTHAPHITITEPLDAAKFQKKTLVRGESPDLDIASVQFQYKKAQDTVWFDLGSALTKTPFITYIDPDALNFGTTYGVDYNIRVKSRDKAGNDDPSPMTITLTYTDVTAPAAPVNLQATVNGDVVSLTWTQNQEIDLNGYNIYRVSSDGTKTKLNTDIYKTTSYPDNGLADGDYTYTVTAVDTYDNESQPSNSAVAKIYAPQLSQPYTPTAKKTISMSGSNAGSNNTVEMFIDIGAVPVSQGTFSADSQGNFNIPGLNLVLGENKITATAKDANGNISKTSEAIYVVSNEAPSMPTGFTAAAQNYIVALTWNPNPESDIFGYNVYSDGIKVNASSPVPFGNYTASSSQYYGTSENAFDGNSSTYWTPDTYCSTDSPAWWEIDLTASELINHIEINWLSGDDGNGNETIYGGKNYEIQVWSGHAWITQEKVMGNTSKQNIFDFSPSYRTDKIRIYITDVYDPYNLGLVDVKINKDDLISQTNYYDNNAPDGWHKYKITAVDYYGFESVPTDEQKVAVGDIILPDAPQNLTASASGSDVNLNWDANTEPDWAGYIVYRMNGQEWIRLNADYLLDQNNYTDGGLANGTYIYRVTAVDAVGNESLPSNEAQAVVNIELPQSPILSVSVAAQSGALNATWSYSGQPPAGYNLYRSATSGGPYLRINSDVISANNFVDINLTNGTTYYYVATAVDAFGNESVYSNESMGTPLDLEPLIQPSIYYPTITGVPIIMYENITDVLGSSKPGSIVELFKNGVSQGKVSALGQNEVRNIVQDGAQYIFGMSPDGKIVIYITDNYTTFWLKDLVGGTVKQIPMYQFVTWAPDSSQIAYTNSNDYRISLYNIKTGVSTALTADQDQNIYEQPLAWSFDGNIIAYLRINSMDWSYNVWVKNIKNGDFKQITSSGNVYNAKMSPDGTKIAYFDNDELFVTNIDNLNSVKIDLQTDSYSIGWSPDSKKISYVSVKNTPSNILIVDVEANTVVKTINSTNNALYPIWSPDGRSIIFLQDDNSGGYSVSEAPINSENLNLIIPNSNSGDIDWIKSGEIVYFDQNQNQLNAISLKGQFKFNDVSLMGGTNTFYAVAYDASGNQSAPSDEVSVIYNTSSIPDLAITADDIFVYPSYPKPGEKVSVYISPRNAGALDIANVDVAIYLHSNDKWQLLNYENISSITAGASHLLHFELSDLAAGTSTIFVAVDPENTINEISEDNNTAFKDIIVMEQNGVVMTTALDAAQYTAGQDVNVSVDLKNSGENINATLLINIEDENGGIAATLSNTNVAMPYASTNDFSFVWNTSGTFDGKYRVHSVLKANGAVVAENIVPFSILPDVSIASSITTDKTNYGSNENVSVSAGITNASKNHIIAELTARIKIADASGNIIFTEDKHLSNILTGSSNNLGSIWNSGNSTPGAYHASVEIILDNQIVSTKTTNFVIDSFVQITGSITPALTSVLFGSDAKLNYNIQNSGNIALSGLDIKVLIIDPDNQSILSIGGNILDLIINAILPGDYTASTQGYALKTYTAVLQYTYNGVTKKIASTSFTVRDGLPPVVTVISPLPDKVYGSQIDLTVTATDDSSGVDKVEYKTDNGDWKLLPVADPSTGRYSITWNAIKSDEGSHVISFRATDKAGNAITTTPIGITVDLTPPVITVISPIANKIYGSQVELTVTATDSASGVDRVEYLTDNNSEWKQLILVEVSAGKYSATWNPVKSDEGSRTIIFRATDKAGNAITTTPIGITVDLTPPNAPVITSPANNSTVTANIVDINGTAEAGSIVTMILAGVTTTTQTDSATGAFVFKAVNLVSGSNTFTFTATDKAANVSAPPASYTLNVLSITSKVAVNKAKYTINENLIATSSITNGSSSSAFKNLTARVFIVNNQGQTLFTEDKPVANIDPQQTITVTTNWNTAVNPSGTYIVKLNVLDGTNVISNATASFEITGTSITGDGLTGAVTVKPDFVYIGEDENIAYAIANSGNEDVPILDYNIKVIDPTTQVVKKVFTGQQTIVKGNTIAGSYILSTTDYTAGIYSVILEVKTPAMTAYKTISSTSFEVKAGMEITKKVPDNVNILIWVNKKCTPLQNILDIFCLCDDDKNSVRTDLLENALKDASVSYFIVYNKADFQRELRNSSFTDYMILGDRYPLDSNYADELRELVYSGKGLVSSLYVKYGEPGAPVSGALWLGYLLFSQHTIDLSNSPIATASSFVASGKTANVTAYSGATIAGRIRSIIPHPAIILNNYGQGKSVYYAFDLIETLNDNNYDQIAGLMKNSIIYAHKSLINDSFTVNQLVPVEVKIKSLGSVLDLRIKETYPAQIKIYDPASYKWITDNPWISDIHVDSNATNYFRYYALTPETPGTYTLQTDVGSQVGSDFQLYQTLNAQITVGNYSSSILPDNIITALKALKVSILEKLTLSNAIHHMETVKYRNNTLNGTKAVYNDNIHDIIEAIEAVMAIKSCDTTQVRLMMDMLLRIYESKYYLG